MKSFLGVGDICSMCCPRSKTSGRLPRSGPACYARSPAKPYSWARGPWMAWGPRRPSSTTTMLARERRALQPLGPAAQRHRPPTIPPVARRATRPRPWGRRGRCPCRLPGRGRGMPWRCLPPTTACNPIYRHPTYPLLTSHHHHHHPSTLWQPTITCTFSAALPPTIRPPYRPWPACFHHRRHHKRQQQPQQHSTSQTPLPTR